jgi:hypothetical protein
MIRLAKPVEDLSGAKKKYLHETPIAQALVYSQQRVVLRSLKGMPKSRTTAWLVSGRNWKSYPVEMVHDRLRRRAHKAV